ncbi:MAG: glycosyltransferase family 4 protein [Patescibacteria group bacterium]|nr:glycosyltransferase family 4 protein [Patescibacteria group bacterium]MCL5431691.1 glycosyltransferase family 4 protein [Patescibacteria group bacterium]
MKIAFLSFYSGHVARGVETYVHELANRLAANHQVTVCQGGPRLSDARYNVKTIPVHVNWEKINGLRHLSTLIIFDLSFSNMARRFYLDFWSRAQAEFAKNSLAVIDADTDIIVSAGSGWVSLFARLWCWRHKAKLVIAGQSGPGWDDRINLFCRPDVFIGLTDYQVTWARQNGFGAKVVKIANGVDLKKFNAKTKRAALNLPRPIILCVAALDPGKRVGLTIRAVANLAKGSLVVLGKGNLKEELDRLAARLLPGRYLNLFVSHDQTPSYYAACDLVTMVPPKTESFGIVFLEAMASGKAVVTSDDPPRREIVGLAGLFVNPESLSNYTEALEKALTIDWDNMPRHQAEKFSWDEIAKQYESLIRNL